MSRVSENISNIHLENRYAARWRAYTICKAKIWMRGTVHCDGKFYREDDAPTPFARIASLLGNENSYDLGALLNQLNGFFAIVIQKDNVVFSAVDRVRSIPLFYGQANGEVYLSDDAEWIRQNVGNIEMDSIASQEFLFTGYVTGPDTLFPNVKQLQAGEFLLAKQHENEPNLKTHRYYRFLHTEPTVSVNEDALLEQLAAISETVVQRLINYADGRQIVVPLSAGYDSRLIVTLLRKLKYENVITFSYGALGNRESQISKAVAESLNYEWEFVKYSNSLWRKWWRTKERIEYQWMASGWTSLPIFQDWPAVWHLKQTGKLQQDAVFSPGHTGDFISGGHIPAGINPDDKKTKNDLCQYIIDNHYILTNLCKADAVDIKNWQDRIIDFAEAEIIETGKGLANYYEKWEWQERQAKFIINSVRAYEFWGYDWYLPLWDRDFMHFWQVVSLALRRQKIFYDRMAEKLYKSQCSRLKTRPVQHEIEKVYRVSATLSRLNKFINKNPAGSSVLKAYRKMKRLRRDYTHPLRWYGIQSIKDYVNMNPISINSIIASSLFTDAMQQKSIRIKIPLWKV